MSSYSTVSPRLFKTIHVALIRGDGFTNADLGDGMPAVLVNQAAAARFWPGEDAIGKRLRPAESPSGQTLPLPWSIVKGVVANVRHEGLRLAPKPMVYMPLSAANERIGRTFSFAIRGPRALGQAELVRATVAKLDPDMPVAALQLMDGVVERSVRQFSFTLLTLSIAAVIALVLGSVGLYGVLSYAVSLRTREIGVRIALGAQPAIVKRTILVNAAVITVAGLVIGGVAAAGLTRLLGTLLYETDPLDPATLVAAALVLLAVSLLAAYLPARRAASVSPIEAMRAD
jgi:putative ABC transport system permease protein